MSRPRGYAVLLLLSLLLAGSAAAEQKQRSVILILVDSLRADALQTYGSRRVTSPEILRFSKSATVFTHAYTNAPWTRPSTQSLITGRYPNEISVNPGGGTPLVDGHPTLGTVLKAWGYRTGGFYNTAQLTPALANMQGGFDQWVDYGGTSGADLTKGFVATGVNHVIEFLDQSKKPTFAFLHLLDPHHPYMPARNIFGKTATDKFRDSFSMTKEREPYIPGSGKIVQCLLAKDLSVAGQMRELYDSEIREVDRELGRLFRFIENDKRYADALVIITADHGEEFGEHGGWYHGRMFEETLRVPLIIRDPARPHGKGRRVNALVSLVDVFPTVLQAVGITGDATPYSGKSLVEYFTRRGGLPRTTLFFDKPGCYHEPVNAVRHGDWKMIIYLYKGMNKFELFNLASDPMERTDISESKDPAVQTAIATIMPLYRKWYQHVSRPLSTRFGGASDPIPPELLERLKALGYLNN